MKLMGDFFMFVATSGNRKLQYWAILGLVLGMIYMACS